MQAEPEMTLMMKLKENDFKSAIPDVISSS